MNGKALNAIDIVDKCVVIQNDPNKNEGMDTGNDIMSLNEKTQKHNSNKMKKIKK